MKQLHNAGLLASIALALMLTACGGGSGGGGDGGSSTPSTPPNAAPVANAGTAQTGYTDSLLTLDGSASADADGDPLTYTWALTSVPTGSTAALSDATAQKPTLTPDLVGSYTASLVVNDGKTNSTAASVTLTVDQRFIKLDATGTALADSAASWSCVRDRARGLVWEVKNTTDPADLRYYLNVYTHYDDTTQAQYPADASGGYINPTQAQIDAGTNAIGFKTAVNAQGLCGATDWRLPDIDELSSLLKGASAPYIDTRYFPDVDVSRRFSCRGCKGWFWSSTAYPPPYVNTAYFVDFNLGIERDTVRYGLNAVRLVRSGQ